MTARIVCSQCSELTPRTGPTQKFCEPCSTARDIERKTVWHGRLGRTRGGEARSRIALHGAEISRDSAKTIYNWRRPIDLAWMVNIRFPFDWAASKNHIWARRADGHVRLREEGRQYRHALTLTIRRAIAGRHIAHNKVWLDVFIQKASHRGDAANFVDMICDATKDAIGIDDNWYSIRRLDWEVVKANPHIFIGIGQEAVADAQVCSSCGLIRPYDEFQKHKGNKRGLSLNCRECSSARRRGRS